MSKFPRQFLLDFKLEKVVSQTQDIFKNKRPKAKKKPFFERYTTTI